MSDQPDNHKANYVGGVMASKMRNNCPACGDRMKIRNSHAEAPLIRAYQMQCINPLCALTVIAQMEILYSIAPSALPNPATEIPPAPDHVLEILSRRRRAEQDDDRQIAMFDT